ncbi:acetyl-CoA C-acetyltransferase [Pseudarthrobacter enclensis]|uniref:acetyl-CoA C-acyltransferase n=1 Tax=Pseudarthrobacter enclensis TaxID=993070 RepID=A0A0V8I5E6_9MICC|nr:acetyl-CoA C-acyltransferase [Pseudarthrobacter enclensis]KSU70015.1 acetyl-CoA acetyltransferase [Pseudarthrobacter enclensis]SCC30255.1 acetyl-CoA C-acetyltransferase [Pseudarthrobacter enclensis]
MESALSPDDAVVVAYARTPFGRARKGSLVLERPEDLSRAAVRAVLSAVPQLPPVQLEDFYLGTAAPEGAQGDNIPRRVAVLEGLDTLPGVTLNRFCASSLEAAAAASRAIRAGDGDAYLVGGVESTSMQPPATTNPYPGSESWAERANRVFESGEEWQDPRLDGHAPDMYIAMGKTAEFVARVTGTTRQDQDEWALASQRRAVAAIESGYFAGEIVPYTRADGAVISADDGPRPTTTLEGLGNLQPAFAVHGSVTAGNASPLNDGASAAVMMSARRAAELGIPPLARILGVGASALSPEIMGLGPIEASQRLLKRLGMTIDDIDIVELNEAFAAQVVPVVRSLGADPEKVNPHGGAIAVGHPFGATGVRLMGTLINGLRQTDGSLGLATLCVGGGQGMALVLERLS